MKLINYIKEKEQIAINNKLEKEAIKILLIELKYRSLTHLVASFDEEIDSCEFDVYVNKYLIDKLPIQYILGYAYFYGNKFTVNSNVLIPRCETEILVEKTIEYINKYNYKKVLDLCTGSGCIALSIKNELKDLDVYASDISKDALDVAYTNMNNLNTNITLIHSDMFNNINTKFDVIVSNPPYIPYEETNSISEIVYNNEPHLALFTSDFGLYYYKEIIRNSNKYLNSSGMILFEIGYNQKDLLSKFLDDEFPNYQYEFIKDYNDIYRILIVKVR